MEVQNQTVQYQIQGSPSPSVTGIGESELKQSDQSQLKLEIDDFQFKTQRYDLLKEALDKQSSIETPGLGPRDDKKTVRRFYSKHLEKINNIKLEDAIKMNETSEPMIDQSRMIINSINKNFDDQAKKTSETIKKSQDIQSSLKTILNQPISQIEPTEFHSPQVSPIIDSEGYFKKMGQKYRQKYHEAQSELMELQDKIQAEKHIQEKLFHQSMQDIETYKNHEITDLQNEIRNKEDQIYDCNQQCLIYERQNQILKDENHQLKSQLDSIKKENKNTIEKLKEQLESEFKRQQQSHDHHYQLLQDQHQKELTRSKNVSSGQISVLKQQIEAYNQSFSEKRNQYEQIQKDYKKQLKKCEEIVENTNKKYEKIKEEMNYYKEIAVQSCQHESQVQSLECENKALIKHINKLGAEIDRLNLLMYGKTESPNKPTIDLKKIMTASKKKIETKNQLMDTFQSGFKKKYGL